MPKAHFKNLLLIATLACSHAWAKQTPAATTAVSNKASFEVTMEGGLFHPHKKEASWKIGESYKQTEMSYGGMSIMDRGSQFGVMLLSADSDDQFEVSTTNGDTPTESLKGHFIAYLLTKRFRLARVMNNHVLLSGTVGIGRQSQNISYVALPGGIEEDPEYSIKGYAALAELKAQYWWTNHNLLAHSHKVSKGNEDGSSLFVKLSYLKLGNDFTATDPAYMARKIVFNQSGYSIDFGTSMVFDL